MDVHDLPVPKFRKGFEARTWAKILNIPNPPLQLDNVHIFIKQTERLIYIMSGD